MKKNNEIKIDEKLISSKNIPCIISNNAKTNEKDEIFMLEAIKQAEKARKKGEVPIGAVIVCNNKIIAKAHNLRQTTKDATSHAEILAIKKACKKLKTWHLVDCELYVTLEPCPMCSGAIINARINRVVFGAFDSKAGCCGTLYNLPLDSRFNHRPKQVIGGVLETQCADMLSSFFKSIRDKKNK